MSAGKESNAYRVDAQHRPTTERRGQSDADRLEMLKAAERNTAGEPALRLAQPPEETVPARRGPAAH
ncbi:MAG TPA: hypothetical protein VJ746_07685, partial [Nitrospira sp.]|nr:hypothetical protein [Nitrospira sp.]